MKFLAWFTLVSLGAAFAQAPALPNLPDATVIAEFQDGYRLTMGEFRKIFAVLSPAQQQSALQDRTKFLQQWGFFRKLTKMAEAEKLQEKSPYKEAIEQYRMQILSEAKIADAMNQVVVEPAEIVRSYENDKNKYAQVKIKALYIAFSDEEEAAGEKKPLTEKQALAKAKRLLAAARAGEDFVKLVKDNSDDETSRARGGDFDTLRFTDNIPDAFRSAVFNLKPGEITEPLKQTNGYYLLRAEEVSYRPLSDVRDEIYNDLKNAKAREWMDRMNMEATVKIVNPAFVGR